MKRPPIAAVLEYVHAGAHNFDHQSRDLKEHMRAAHAVSQAPPLPNPDQTGTVSAAVLASLWQIFSYVGTNWQISQASTMEEGEFNAVMALKTGQAPSYFTVYQQADALLTLLLGAFGGNLQQALGYLFTPNPSNPPPDWDVVTAWVAQEFANLYVSQGAFRIYGWWLYPGFAGGPFDGSQPLPYRPAPNGA